jgi:hypothetical protein
MIEHFYTRTRKETEISGLKFYKPFISNPFPYPRLQAEGKECPTGITGSNNFRYTLNVAFFSVILCVALLV